MPNEQSKRTPVPSVVALSLSINRSKTMTISAALDEKRTTSTDSAVDAIVDCFVSSAIATMFQR